MVVLSTAITTKNGKTLLARQFVDMSRIRIEGLLAAFPKLLGTGNKQHTFIETESVRYVYQPMEGLYLLLITNKASNIVEDLETLRLLSKVVPDVAGGVNEDNVSNAVFELVFAVDEVIMAGGYKESVTLEQINTNMAMDSHEERLHNMIQDSKRASAKEESQRRARELRERQKEMAASGLGGGGGMQGIGGGMGGGGGGGGGGSYNTQFDAVDTPAVVAPQAYTPRAGSGGGGSAMSKPAVKGMKLGGGPKGKNVLDSLMAEEKLAPIPALGSGVGSAGGGGGGGGAVAAVDAIPAAAPIVTHPVTILIEEKLTCQLSREGALESLDLKGTLTVTANQETDNKCQLELAVLDEAGCNFATHPKVNKQLYDTHKVLVLKDAAKGFPVARPVGVLRWSMTSADEAHLPLTINCWPEEEGGGMMNVNIEYSLSKPNMSLHDVRICVPLGTSEAPQIVSIDGAHRHNATEGVLIWTLDMVDQSNATGSLEFNIASRRTEAFFPIEVSFSSTQLYAQIQVLSVKHTEGGKPVQYGYTSKLTTENYLVS